MTKLIKKAFTIMLIFMLFTLSGCSKPPVIEIDDLNDVALAKWTNVVFNEEDTDDEIKDINVNVNDVETSIEYNVFDENSIEFKPTGVFQPETKYLLTVDFESGKKYLMNFKTISQLNQDRLNLAENFFLMPVEGEYDKAEADSMKERILKVSPDILLTLYQAGVKMKFTNRPITEEPELQYLAGSIPRGWEGSGMTWDDVPGAGGYDLPIARIGYSEPSYENNHDTINLELHELGHTVDSYITGDYIEEYLSSSAEFLNIWDSEVFDILPDDYFTYYYEEYFAETFAMYYLDENSKEELRVYAPQTFEFISNLDYYTNINE